MLPGIYATGLHLMPRDVAGPVPLVVAQHGGDGSPELATFHGGANYHDMIRGAAQRGYAVLATQHLFRAPGFPADVRQRLGARDSDDHDSNTTAA